MANSTLSSLTEATALTDADELLVNDGGTSKRITAANARGFFGGPPFTTVDDVRLSGAVKRHGVFAGPWKSVGNNISYPAGQYGLTLSWVRGGTYADVGIRCQTGATTSDLYAVIYNFDSDGLPTTLAHSWGPFDCTSSGNVSITGGSTTVVPGWYFVGGFAPSTNGGTPIVEGALSTMLHSYQLSEEDRQTLITTNGGSDNTPQDLSSLISNNITSTGLKNDTAGVLLLNGESA